VSMSSEGYGTILMDPPREERGGGRSPLKQDLFTLEADPHEKTP
jgi:hypothetical protein